MGLLDKWIEEDDKITDDLYGFLPEEREEYLMSAYGRTKEEFPWIDFGDDAEESMSDDEDDDYDDDEDDDDDDFDEDDEDDDDDDFEDDDDPW